ncbi:MAG: response regulator transcription factor [Actinomycetales bacterium]|nr:response regulator transcription factor [Actinomycetales bacterium]
MNAPTGENIKVLIVDDEASIRDLLTRTLRFEEFETHAVSNGTDAVEAVETYQPDIILLDVMLPDMNGFSVTKKIRSQGVTTPVLFLTAKDEPEHKVQGLTVGGDDYVTKPFSLAEIVARIHAILRRTKASKSDDSLLEVGEVTINNDAHEVFVNGNLIDLSPTEYNLLHFMMSNPNQVLKKEQILNHVWEYDFGGNTAIVESYVSYLRRKLDAETTEPVIVTKRGVGYMFRSAKKA